MYKTFPTLSTLLKPVFSKNQLSQRGYIYWNMLKVSKFKFKLLVICKAKLIKIRKLTGVVDQNSALKVDVLIFNIITTNKNKTAIAPTYTISNRNAKNSAPKSSKSPATLQKTTIKNKTECTALVKLITIIAEISAKLEKK